MSPPIRSCVICGWVVYGTEETLSWENQFRGLYACPEGIALTGVGRLTHPRDGIFIAPPDPDARWDDPGYDNPEEHSFEPMGREKSWRPRRGYIFHDVCWSLVGRAMHPAPVPKEALFQVLDSLPKDYFHSRLLWGHDYGGLGILNDEHHFPWEERFEERDFADEWFDTVYNADPFSASEASRILEETPRAPPPTASSGRHSVVLTENDPFNTLPAELCSAIAEWLPTTDVLNTRLASRSFWHLFHSQQFWASRFRDADRSWLFEVWDPKHRHAITDWRWLYRRTNDGCIGKGLQNRKRIWGLIRGMMPVLELRWNEPSLDPLPPLHWPLTPEEDQQWLIAAGSAPERPGFSSGLENGCHLRRTRRLVVPGPISRVSVSTATVGGPEYVAGISLTSVTGETLRIGYDGIRERSVQLAGLAGFRLAVGHDGIHALQCIDSQTGRPSAWFGTPDDVPKTDRLVLAKPVGALEVSFDVFKMVSIAVCAPKDDSESAPGLSQHAITTKGLRNSALWFPDTPPPTTNLNEDMFVPLSPYTRGFRPLFWTRFGGPGGQYLPRLTSIAVCHVSRGLTRMDFLFDNNDTGVPAECRRFGRYAEAENSKNIEFLIDGPGGEVIDQVDICHEYEYPEREHYAPWIFKEGSLVWFKLSTNRGRSFQLEPRPKRPRRPGRLEARTVRAEPGTAIVGFFGSQYRTYAVNLAALGVMTEPLGELS